jgi:CRISPR type IV-associated protein Csf3
MVVRAELSSAIMCGPDGIALDALLMAAVALRDNLPPIGFGERRELAIPIAKERGVYMASLGQWRAEAHERRHVHRRPPVLEAQSLGSPQLRRMVTTAGPNKAYRIPVSVAHAENDAIVWFALGDPVGVRELVALIGYVGKKRSVGLGRVTRWTVEDCEAWPGFPVLDMEGRPLRPLPLDWPGLGAHRVEPRVLEPPYWERWREQDAAVP